MFKRPLALVVVIALGRAAFADAPTADPGLQVATSTPASTTEETIPNPSKKWGWAFGGVAVGTLAIGIGLGGAAAARGAEQEGNAANPVVYTEALKKRGTEGATMADAGYAFIGIGLVTAVIDAVIWYECLRKPRTRTRVAQRLAPSGVRF